MKTLNNIFKIAFCVELVFIFTYFFVYHKITHLNSEDLEWINNVKEEIMVFESQNGTYDTATIKSIEIYNSLNPINYDRFNVSDEYIATANIDYFVVNNNDTLDAFFYIQKESNGNPVCFNTGLGNRFAFNVKPDFQKILIDHIEIDDAIYFDNNNSSLSKYYCDNSPTIRSFVWSKRYGLIQYTFEDGTVYNRITTQIRK